MAVKFLSIGFGSYLLVMASPAIAMVKTNVNSFPDLSDGQIATIVMGVFVIVFMLALVLTSFFAFLYVLWPEMVAVAKRTLIVAKRALKQRRSDS
jgi:hypothetical protein